MMNDKKETDLNHLDAIKNAKHPKKISKARERRLISYSRETSVRKTMVTKMSQ